jgi:transcriptional regulator with XRE-family HTH domain
MKRRSFNVKWFKARLELLGISQREVGRRFGLNQASITHMFKGMRKLQIHEVEPWADILECSLQEILYYSGNARSPVPTKLSEAFQAGIISRDTDFLNALKPR